MEKKLFKLEDKMELMTKVDSDVISISNKAMVSSCHLLEEVKKSK